CTPSRTTRYAWQSPRRPIASSPKGSGRELPGWCPSALPAKLRAGGKDPESGRRPNGKERPDRRWAGIPAPITPRLRAGRAARTVLFGSAPASQQFRLVLGEGVQEGEALAGHQRIGNRLVIVLLQRRLEIVKFQLAGGARHEEIDDALGLGRKVSGFGVQRTG